MQGYVQGYELRVGRGEACLLRTYLYLPSPYSLSLPLWFLDPSHPILAPREIDLGRYAGSTSISLRHQCGQLIFYFCRCITYWVLLTYSTETGKQTTDRKTERGNSERYKHRKQIYINGHWIVSIMYNVYSRRQTLVHDKHQPMFSAVGCIHKLIDNIY